MYLCNLLTEKREFSSVGSERLPYKQRVGGSNPSTPTKASEISGAFLFSNLPRRRRPRAAAKRPALKTAGGTDRSAGARYGHRNCP